MVGMGLDELLVALLDGVSEALDAALNEVGTGLEELFAALLDGVNGVLKDVLKISFEEVEMALDELLADGVATNEDEVSVVSNEELLAGNVNTDGDAVLGALDDTLDDVADTEMVDEASMLEDLLVEF